VIKILNFWLDDRSQDLVTNDDVSGAFVEFVSKKVHAVSADEAGALVTKLETKVRYICKYSLPWTTHY
jgi:hypothetical protein